MLEMRIECLVCKAALTHSSDALICSYECTYCPDCAKELNNICRNCSGDLVNRPKRNK
ncbi:MAG: DUF1272 domain-containing protein [Rhodobacteraceae bacterium]|nr:DUF1272 domain-containing protein [Paracoccaceae bacterium]NCV50603.1 DUF1272 domain-containing protein [Rhodobacterales bacterium]NCW64806.1 DUF1272 domain-containing protein [Paracoccaceae bacterium]NCX07488.1 DUF1272 domain-containing protein [Paracoccaceae bacterium]NCX20240.1 DUF1272 domain-containing protein [Paracoccaceae bacterium]